MVAIADASRLVSSRFGLALEMIARGSPPEVARRRLKIKKRTFYLRYARAREKVVMGLAS